MATDRPDDAPAPHLDMKADWDKRARENAKYYIATTQSESDEVFTESGKRDVSIFFEKVQHLLTPRTDVLDIGCGIGRMDAFVAPHVNRLTGIDVSGEMIAQARERLGHLANVQFLEGDGWSLQGVADASLDLVFSHVVFQHVPRPVFVAYLPEVNRVLRSGGNFLFQIPGANDQTPADPPGDDTFEMRFWHEDDVRERLAAAGLETASVTKFTIEASIRFDYLLFHATKT